MSKNYNSFKYEGHILIKEFIVNNSSFSKLCYKLKKDILKAYKKTDKEKIGGHTMGNLGVFIGQYEKKFYNLLIKNGLDKIIKEITNNKLSDFDIIFGGNLNLPGGYNQHFHMDGSFYKKFIIVNLATENVNEFNGPTEITCNSHKKYTPYWKYLLKKNKNKKIFLSSGDLLIRKNQLWHRGTKNKSSQSRFMLTLALTKNKKIKNKIFFGKNKKIKICSNFFKPSIFGKIEEIIYTRLRYFYIIIRFIKSLFKL